jgi:hypothetical protein
MKIKVELSGGHLDMVLIVEEVAIEVPAILEVLIDPFHSSIWFSFIREEWHNVISTVPLHIKGNLVHSRHFWMSRHVGWPKT